MTNNYNQKLSQLSGLITAFATEIDLDNSLLAGEKFLILQGIMASLKPLEKSFDKSKKAIEEIAKAQLQDLGDGKSDEIELDGASVMIKYAYPKSKLNAERLELDYIKALTEIGSDYNQDMYLDESTPRQTVIIQSIIN
jgi:hypothetical protein